jgi:predicted ATPase/transcriptional regulator with XRE-family HTH domain
VAMEPGPGFGAHLREARRRANLTQERLAARAGLSVRALSDLERGVHGYPRPDSAAMLADALALDGEERAAFLARAQRPIAPPRPSPPGRVGSAGSVPRLPTPLFGRDEALATLATALRQPDTRWLTLTGAGGVGKTHLALSLADRAEPHTRACFVDLSILDDGNGAIPAIARAVGIDGADDPWEALVARLNAEPTLLVLDSCERLGEAARHLADLLAACRPLAVLATCRFPLRLRIERRFAVEPLATEDPGRADGRGDVPPAVALFVERARAVRHDFRLHPGNADDVAAVCHRLGGVPLAIELAAARLDAMSIAELRRRLDEEPELLGGGPIDLPDRQHTLRAAIAWSVDLLGSAARAALPALAAFVGGFGPDAAAAVAGLDGAAVEPVLAELVAHHLIVAETAADGSRRFRLPETVREAVVGQADAQAAARFGRRHADWFLRAAEAAEDRLSGPDQRATLDRLARDDPNLRAALRWAIRNGQAETALRLVAALGTAWEMRGALAEGRSWVTQALAAPGAAAAPSAVRAAAIAAGAALADAQGDSTAARDGFATALGLWRAVGDRLGEARTLNNLGIVADNLGDYAEAAGCYGQALALFRALDRPANVANVLNNLGALAFVRGDFAEAADRHAEALAIRRAVGDAAGVAASLNNAATAASALGEEDRAASLLREALARWRELGDLHGVASASLNLGTIALRRGERVEARRRFEEALALQRRVGDARMTVILRENLATAVLADGDRTRAAALLRDALHARRALGDPAGIAISLIGAAEIAAAGRSAPAAELLGAARAALAATGHVRHPVEAAALDRLADDLSGALGDAAFLAAQERGRTGSLETAIAIAESILEAAIAVPATASG